MKDSPRPLAVRLGLIALGMLLLLIGLAGLFLPLLPGWLFIIPGLVVLAGEFVWAQRLLDGARKRLGAWTGEGS